MKPKFQDLLRPITQALAGAGVTANQVTLAACGLSVLTGLGLAWAPDSFLMLATVPVVLFVRMALNAIDGMLAREHHQSSRLGAVYNELCDVISDSAIYAGYLFIPGLSVWGVAMLVFLGALSEFQGVLAQALTGKRAYQGPFGKSDRALAFGLFAVALLFNAPPSWINGAIALCMFLAFKTLFNRIQAALQ